MKFSKYISLNLLSALFVFSGCAYTEQFDTDPGVMKDQIQQQGAPALATTTFSQLKKDMTSFTLLHDNAGHAKYANTFTSYQIPNDKPCIINAVVVSTDVDGNVYKKLVLRDLQDGSAMDISVDVSNITADYQLGQRVSLDLKGLHIGLYADSPTIGLEYYNDDAKRTRWELGRLPYLIVQERIKAYGLPDISLIEPEVKTIAEIKNDVAGNISRLVRINNVKLGYYLSGTTIDKFETSTIEYVNDTEREVVFSEENSLNVPVSRALADETGTINLTTSFYAKFASKFLPTGTYDIIAIVGWYRDQEAKDGSFQLTLQRYKEDFIDLIKNAD